MGRTGRWFAFEHEGIMPDILVIGKAIGAGLPVSAVVTTESIEKRCHGILGRHVQSHQNDPFSGRVVETVISILQEENLVERAAEIGNQFITGLNNILMDHSSISEVRGRGAMLGVELHPDWSGKGMEISQRLLEAGFIVDYHQSTSTFRLFPPFVISQLEIDAFLRAFRQILRDIRSE
jgi:4-aminobutyrate aminotransferase-like enzyme